jgi:small subunit ribosomal protein S1
MTASYDDQGNYIYPEGFDPETNEWLPGYDKQREEWERQYAEAQARFEAHRKQVDEARKAEAEATTGGGGARCRGQQRHGCRPSTYSSESDDTGARWPRTRPSRRCARSSPAAPDPQVCGRRRRPRPSFEGRGLRVVRSVERAAQVVGRIQRRGQADHLAAVPLVSAAFTVAMMARGWSNRR